MGFKLPYLAFWQPGMPANEVGTYTKWVMFFARERKTGSGIPRKISVVKEPHVVVDPLGKVFY
jgi:hypothetical protein